MVPNQLYKLAYIIREPVLQGFSGLTASGNTPILPQVPLWPIRSGLDLASVNGWVPVSMKDDGSQVIALEPWVEPIGILTPTTAYRILPNHGFCASPHPPNLFINLRFFNKLKEQTMNLSNKLAAEFIGTFWLVLGGCGSAVCATSLPEFGIGLLGVSFAFGLTVLTMAYAIGHISGCHLNPADLHRSGRRRAFPSRQLVPITCRADPGRHRCGLPAVLHRERLGLHKEGQPTSYCRPRPGG